MPGRISEAPSGIVTLTTFHTGSRFSANACVTFLNAVPTIMLQHAASRDVAVASLPAFRWSRDKSLFSAAIQRALLTVLSFRCASSRALSISSLWLTTRFTTSTQRFFGAHSSAGHYHFVDDKQPVAAADAIRRRCQRDAELLLPAARARNWRFGADNKVRRQRQLKTAAKRSRSPRR